MINKGFFTDNKKIELDIPGRLMFIAIWIHATDNGIANLSYKQLKAQAFPTDDDIKADKHIRQYVDQLLEYRLLKLSECGRYVKVANWHSHQTINRPNTKEIDKYEHLKFNFIEDKNDTHAQLNECSVSSVAEEKRIEKRTDQTYTDILELFSEHQEQSEAEEEQINNLSIKYFLEGDIK